MKANSTDISIVLDRSGSMSIVAADTIGGFNQFLKDQKKVPGDCALTLTQFDDIIEIVHAGKKIQDVPELNSLTFVPRGSTALFDAIGQTIVKTGERLSAMPESDRPESILFVILTDGGENASKEYTRDKINEMIRHQTDTYKWTFLFIGANQDAFATGTSLGVQGMNTMSYSSGAIGTRTTFDSLSKGTTAYRTSGGISQVLTDEDREAQAKLISQGNK